MTSGVLFVRDGKKAALLITLFSFPVGGAGGLSDAHLQDGASTAATTSGSVGRVGKRHSTHFTRQTHQRAAGRHGGTPSVRLDGRKLCSTTDENT